MFSHSVGCLFIFFWWFPLLCKNFLVQFLCFFFYFPCLKRYIRKKHCSVEASVFLLITGWSWFLPHGYFSFRDMVICPDWSVSSRETRELIWVFTFSTSKCHTHKRCPISVHTIESKAYYTNSKAVTHHEELSRASEKSSCVWGAKIKDAFALFKCGRIAEGRW